jgi:hypothetical protein
MLDWNQPILAGELELAIPRLIVVAYGTNEALSRIVDPVEYRNAFTEIIRLRAAARWRASWWSAHRTASFAAKPAAAVSAPGRGDRNPAPVALENGCAFWDWRSRMGGPDRSANGCKRD